MQSSEKRLKRLWCAYALLCLLWVSNTYFPQSSQASSISTSTAPSGPATNGLTGNYPGPLIAGVTDTGMIPFQSASPGILTQDMGLAYGLNPNGGVTATPGFKLLTIASSNLSARVYFISNNLFRGSFGAHSADGLSIEDQGGAQIWQQTYNTLNSAFSGDLSVKSLSTQSNCADAGGACGSAAAGSVSIAAAATTVTVQTSAVTANSNIILQYDSSLGPKLTATCNATVPAVYSVTARTAATSFVITSSVAVGNSNCFSYWIVD